MEPVKAIAHKDGVELFKCTILNLHITTDNKEYFLVGVWGSKDIKLVEVSTVNWTYLTLPGCECKKKKGWW